MLVAEHAARSQVRVRVVPLGQQRAVGFASDAEEGEDNAPPPSEVQQVDQRGQGAANGSTSNGSNVTSYANSFWDGSVVGLMRVTIAKPFKPLPSR